MALSAAVVCFWVAVAYGLARWQFARVLQAEEPLSTPIRNQSQREPAIAKLASGFANLFADPTGALIEKELRSLVRMPRFRVVFLLASVFSVIILLPMQMRQASSSFGAQHSLQLMNVYGILILSDALLWNMFGFDRSATQVYFVAPVDVACVIRAKNISAGLFMALQTAICIVFASLLRIHFTLAAIGTDLCGAAVTTLLFLCIGNIGSIANPRAADPKATMRKQNGGMVQLWMLGCSAAACVLLGAAYLAGWAANSAWATIAVLLLEVGIGAIAYRFSVESAVEKVGREREAFLSALDKSSSPVSS
jgi:ABC-2 type transport system permease protein